MESGVCPGRSDHFDSSSTQVDAVTVMQPFRRVPRPRRVRRTIKACRKRTAYLSRSNLRLRVCLRALRVLSGELGVHAVHRIELPVVANVVVVRVAVEHDHGQCGELRRHCLQVTDTPSRYRRGQPVLVQGLGS